MSSGIVFSIEEFSVFDGPGIRTSVFLKGCPLRCMWCHNPEGQSFSPQLMRSNNGCIGCGRCLNKGMELKGRPCLVPESIAECPNNLIRLCGEEISAKALCERLSLNADMLKSAGGGITFSGGEPLSQPEFLEECLMRLSGVAHRALQTSGFAEGAVFERILKNIDYVLFDLKLIDDERHKYYTGVSNKLILNNFSMLCRSGKPFCVRVPLIPTVNDTAENLRQTAELLLAHEVKKIELLPYNKMAGGKYAAVGREYTPEFDGSLEPQLHKEIFGEYKIEVNVL